MAEATHSKKIFLLVVLFFLLVILLVAMFYRQRIRQIDHQLKQQHIKVR